jgi:hypothetical protein
VNPVPDPLLLRKSGSAGNRTWDLWVISQELWPLDHRGGPPDLTPLDSCFWGYLKLGFTTLNISFHLIRIILPDKVTEFLSVYLTLPAAQRPGVYSASNTNKYWKWKEKCFWEVESGRCIILITSPPSTSLNMSQPYRPPRNGRGQLYFCICRWCKIWGFHGGDYEELCLLGCYAVWLL